MKAAQQEECVLCCREIVIFAIGICDHTVCYECSTRMRVLCEANECPICRANIPLVVFTHQRTTFLDVHKKFSLINRKYNIVYEDDTIRSAFLKLLENRCKYCEESLNTFKELKSHVRCRHDRYYCELCIDNLKIFPFERKSYNRSDLAMHKRKGDRDETSHRGHPECEFCQQRFVDKDELYLHLRREHYFCHFCDADGKHEYYDNYNSLKVHFRQAHFLCEEGDCANEQFVGAFRNEIDLKAHFATTHSRHKSKLEAKQARVLDVDISFAASSNRLMNTSPRSSRYASSRKNIEQLAANSTDKTEAKNIDTHSTQDFPFLSNGSVNNTAFSNNNLDKSARNPVSYRKPNAMSTQDFPALGATSSLNASSQAKRQNGVIKTSPPNFNKLGQFQSTDFPSLGATASNSNPPRWLDNSSKASSSQKQVSSVSNKAVKKDKVTKKDQILNQWSSEKNLPTFQDDEFPRLQSKKKTPKVPVRYPSPPKMRPATSRPVLENIPLPSEKLLVITKKSKNPKVKVCLSSDDSDDEPHIDPFKKSMVHPSLQPELQHIKVNSTWEEKAFDFDSREFPKLDKVSKKPTNTHGAPKRKPPGMSTKCKAPPGFNDYNAPLPEPTTLTLASLAQIILPKKTTSNENSDPPLPTTFQPYLNPVDMEQRNSNLTDQFNEFLKGDITIFKDFKIVSQQFRRGEIPASAYYTKCLEILGDSHFEELFPEMLALLPDIAKQQELLAAHKEFLQKEGGSSQQGLISCKLCFQVVLGGDYKNHLQNHQR